MRGLLIDSNQDHRTGRNILGASVERQDFLKPAKEQGVDGLRVAGAEVHHLFLMHPGRPTGDMEFAARGQFAFPDGSSDAIRYRRENSVLGRVVE